MLFLVERSDFSTRQTNTSPSISCKPTCHVAGGGEPEIYHGNDGSKQRRIVSFARWPACQPNQSLAGSVKWDEIRTSVLQKYLRITPRAPRDPESVLHRPGHLSDQHFVDFASNDSFSWNTTGFHQSSSLEELSRYPDFRVGASASRVAGGNYTYLDETELEIASFQGAETSLLVNSAFDANVMLWTAIPRPGVAIIYDSAVHASKHEGMHRSVANQEVEF